MGPARRKFFDLHVANKKPVGGAGASIDWRAVRSRATLQGNEPRRPLAIAL